MSAPDRRAGRWLAAALLLQLTGLIVPFVLLSVLYATPGYLESAAGHASRIQLALFLLLANGALTVGVSQMVGPRLRAHAPALADWLVVLSAAWLLLQAVDGTRVMELVALSRGASETSAASRETFALIGAAAAAARRFTHYTVLLVIGAWMLVFYAALWRARAVPTIIGALGVLAAALHLGGVSLPVMLGYPGWIAVAPSLAVSHAAVIGWLVVRGLRQGTPPGS